MTFAENWSQSKYVVSDPRTVWPECVYNPRDLCVSDPRDLLLESEIQKKGDWKRNFYEIFA